MEAWYCINTAIIFSDSLSQKSFIVLQLVVRMKSDKNSCAKNEKKVLEREVQYLAPVSPPPTWPIMVWSQCECHTVGFEKVHKWSDTDPPNPMSERCGGRGFSKLLTEYTGPLSPLWQLQEKKQASGRERKVYESLSLSLVTCHYL